MVVTTAHAFTCPSTPSITSACLQLNVLPLVCSNPQVNVKECNDKQCSQPYVDKYAVCQCRGSTTDFFKAKIEQSPPRSSNAHKVESLIKRCRLTKSDKLVNPYVPVKPTTSPTAQPIVGPSPTNTPVSASKVSGGAIAGWVLGLLATAGLAALLAICWRRKRRDPIYNQHLLADPRGAARTVVTEKIEPVVVKAVPSSQVYTGTPGAAGVGGGNVVGHGGTAVGGGSSNIVGSGGEVVAPHPSTSYNTTTTSGY
ncbi:hypothetical protein BGZ73_003621 [Actinomortierella ambigua]|nr:hypothetical protein BGZ73_003621 [Actinomortierella ambigua]